MEIGVTLIRNNKKSEFEMYRKEGEGGGLIFDHLSTFMLFTFCHLPFAHFTSLVNLMQAQFNNSKSRGHSYVALLTVSVNLLRFCLFKSSVIM